MRQNGFDIAKPILLWNGIVIDGYTRLKAANSLKLDEIPVRSYKFKSEEEAVDFAVSQQVGRRNLTEQDIIRLVKVIDKHVGHGGDRKSDKYQSSTLNLDSLSATAQKIGVSRSKVYKARYILKHADLLESEDYRHHRPLGAEKNIIFHGLSNKKISINAAYEAIKRAVDYLKKRADSPKTEDLTITPSEKANELKPTVPAKKNDKAPPAVVEDKTTALSGTAEKTKKKTKKIRKEDIVSVEFQEAYDAFYRQVQNAKLEKWGDTSKEACLQMLGWIHDLIDISTPVCGTTITWYSLPGALSAIGSFLFLKCDKVSNTPPDGLENRDKIISDIKNHIKFINKHMDAWSGE